MIDILKKIYNNDGISGFRIDNLTKYNIYNLILKKMHQEKHTYDLDEYCCILIGEEDNYIMYISICND